MPSTSSWRERRRPPSLVSEGSFLLPEGSKTHRMELSMGGRCRLSSSAVVELVRLASLSGGGGRPSLCRGERTS